MTDLLLKDAARAFRASVRGTDVFARVGDDRFAVALVGCDDMEGASAFCRRLRDALGVLTSERPVDVQVRFGVQELGSAGGPADALAHAEEAAGVPVWQGR